MAIYEPISKVNLERITNGIFAFTMTLLARNILMPDPGSVKDLLTFDTYILKAILSVIDFVGIFILLAMFWMLFFQMFRRMKTYDYHFLHVHMLALMAIVLLPFTSGFTALSENLPFADLFFQANYLMLGVILAYLWHYALSRPELLAPGLSDRDARFLLQKCLVPPAVAGLGIIMVLSSIKYLDLLYFLPFIIIAIFFREPPVEEPIPEG
ncbi:MAG: TMEM175 family protein [Methanomicrobiales archaeon]